MNEYLTAAAIVFVVVAVSLISGWYLLSKLSFTQQRTVPTIVGMNNGLFALLSKYRKWRIVDMVDEKAMKKYSLYLDHGLNQSFCLMIRANKRGIVILKSHKKREGRSLTIYKKLVARLDFFFLFS